MTGNESDKISRSTSQLFRCLCDITLDPERRRFARTQVIEAYLPFADRSVAELRPHREVREDAVQAGRIGLIHAVDRFDPERGIEFTAFARPTIIGEVLHHFRDHGSLIRIPRSHYDLAHRARSRQDQLRHTLGREPNAEDLAAFLGVSTDRLCAAFAAEDACCPRSLESLHPGAHPSVWDQRLVHAAERIDLSDCIEQLPPLERRVLMLHVIHEMTQEQVGMRLGMTQMQVSRTAQRAIRYLKYLLDG